MNQLDRLKAEEVELEAAHKAQMLGNPEDTSAATGDVILETAEQLEADEVMGNIIVPPSSEDDFEEADVDIVQPQKQTRTNWKKRFTNYKSATDGTINGLRRELIDMRSQVANLMAEANTARNAQQEVQGDLFDGAFSQEEEETFGTDGLDVVKKAAKVAIERQVKPLQEELRRQENNRIKDMQDRAQGDKQTQYNGFLENLEMLVPDYAELNRDSSFLGWMSGKDTYGTQVRMDLFRAAERGGDVTRVADFFTEFKETLSEVTDLNIVPEAVRKHITPVGGGGSTATPRQNNTEPVYYKESDVNKFYSDLTKGRFDGQKAKVDQSVADIELAYSQGRVLKNQ
jgi:hypothetical protein